MRKRDVQKILRAFDRAMEKSREKRAKAKGDEFKLFRADMLCIKESFKATGDLVKSLRQLVVESSYQ